jgi:ankyrin repeat protein
LPFSTVLAARNYGIENIRAPANATLGSKLCMAILRCDNMEVRKLLSMGADINYQDAPDGWTPLIYSIYYGNIHAREILLDCGADIHLSDYANRTPLIFAAIKGDKNFLLKLLDAGADPSIIDNRGKSALDFAREYHNEECAIILQVEKHLNRGEQSYECTK